MKYIHKLLSIIIISALITGVFSFSSFAFIKPKKHDNTIGNLAYDIFDDEAVIVGCIGSAEGKIEIPSEIDGYPVTTIGPNAFSGYFSVTEIVIPDSVTCIEYHALSNCGIRHVFIPASVESIGSSAFYGSPVISITVAEGNPVYHSDGNCIIETETKTLVAGCDKSAIPADGSVTVIGEGAFDQCNFKEFVIPDIIEKIDTYAFGFCWNLEKITIPDSVKIISDRVFKDCGKLKSIVIPDSVESIGEGAFDDCYDLADITIGSGVKSIGRWAFSGCGLNSVSISKKNKTYHTAGNCIVETDSKLLIKAWKNCLIPDDGSVTTIGAYAFEYGDFGDVIIPDCITGLEESAFYFCHLKKAVIGNGVKEIPEAAFFRCWELAEVIIGSSVESIGRDAFTGCRSLTAITIPDNVKRIDMEAFWECDALESITIGTGLESIGEDAFLYCERLFDVYYGGDLNDWKNIHIEEGNDNLEKARIHFADNHYSFSEILYAVKASISFFISLLQYRLRSIILYNIF